MVKCLLSIIVIFFLSSCIDPPPPRLSKALKKELDSLYIASKDSLNIIADKNCEEKHVSIYQAAIDSIQNLRREEIESIIGQ